MRAISMRNLCIVATISMLLGIVSSQSEYYNIISIDGGGIRGLIPASILQKIEKEAYDYAVSKNYKVPEYPGVTGKVAMKDLFDMTAGTSTGSIIAAALSMPATEKDSDGNEKLSTTRPQFWADDIVEIYRNDNDKIFDKNEFNQVYLIIIVLFVVPLFIFFGHQRGEKKFDNDKKLRQFIAIREKIEHRQRRMAEGINSSETDLGSSTKGRGRS